MKNSNTQKVNVKFNSCSKEISKNCKSKITNRKLTWRRGILHLFHHWLIACNTVDKLLIRILLATFKKRITKTQLEHLKK